MRTFVSMDFDIKLRKEQLAEVEQPDIDVATVCESENAYNNMSEQKYYLLMIFSISSGDRGFFDS